MKLQSQGEIILLFYFFSSVLAHASLDESFRDNQRSLCLQLLLTTDGGCVLPLLMLIGVLCMAKHKTKRTPIPSPNLQVTVFPSVTSLIWTSPRLGLGFLILMQRCHMQGAGFLQMVVAACRMSGILLIYIYPFSTLQE